MKNCWGQSHLNKKEFPLIDFKNLDLEKINCYWNSFEPFAGANVDTYIIDTGLFSNHDQFSNSDVTVLFDPFNTQGQDSIGHGTAISSLIFGKKLGAAPHSKIFILKIFDKEKVASQELLLLALEKIMSHHVEKIKSSSNTKSIVNISLTSAITENLISILEQLNLLNMLVVISTDNLDRADYLRPSKSINSILFVGGIQENLKPISNTPADLYGPGHQILVASKSSIQATHLMTGNSIAAAFATGVAAALWSKASGYSAQELKACLFESCDTINNLKLINRLNIKFEPQWSVAETGIIATLKPGQSLTRKLRCQSKSKSQICFKIKEGFLPPGLTLTHDGIISGTAELQEDANPDHLNYFSTIIRAENSEGFVDRNISFLITQNVNQIASSKKIFTPVQLAKCNMLADDAGPMDNHTNGYGNFGDGINGNVIIDCCFAAESLVLLSNGRSKKISEILITDTIYQENQVGKVLAVIAVPLTSYRKIYQINNLSLFLTSEHPLYNSQNMPCSIDPTKTKNLMGLETVSLSVGTALKNLESQIIVNQITEFSYPANTIVYHIYVDGDGSYFVGGVKSHRKYADLLSFANVEERSFK